MEVDLLVETPRGIVAMEIKSRETVERADRRALRAIREAAGDRCRAGIVVYRGDRVQRFEDGLWAIPSRRLFT